MCGGPVEAPARICDLCDEMDMIEPVEIRKGRKVYDIKDVQKLLDREENIMREKKFKQKQRTNEVQYP
jgi:uncharacterized membrane protein